MNCPEIQVKAAALLLDGDHLPSEERREIEQHLSRCSSCKRDLELEAATRNVLRHRYHSQEAPRPIQESIRRLVDKEFMQMLSHRVQLRN